MGFYESHGDSVKKGATLRNRFRRTSPKSGASRPAEVLLRLTEEEKESSHSQSGEGLTSTSQIWGRGCSKAPPALEPPSPAGTRKGHGQWANLEPCSDAEPQGNVAPAASMSAALSLAWPHCLPLICLRGMRQEITKRKKGEQMTAPNTWYLLFSDYLPH